MALQGEKHMYLGSFYRKDRNRHGGGVFLAIKNCYTSSALPETDKDCEIIWAQVALQGEKHMYLGSFYRPPDTKEDKIAHLKSSITSLPKSADQKLVNLAGDFNAPDIDWETGTIKESNKTNLYQEILNTSNDCGITQIQKEPTREKNVLDLFFTNNTSLVKSTNVIPGISDHEMVIIDSDIRPKLAKPPKRKVYKYRNANWDEIKKGIIDFNTDFLTSTEFNSRSVNDNWTMFKHQMTKIMDKFIPSKITSTRYNLPWLNKKLKKAVKAKQRLYNKAKRSKKVEDWATYKRVKSETQKSIRKAQWDYVENILVESFDKNDTKPFWKFIKAKRQDNVGVAPIKDQGILYSENEDKAELINKQFESVFTREDVTNIPQLEGTPYTDISDLVITTLGVEKLLKDLATSKASGPDLIPNRFLKECATEIAPILQAIFTQSLETGELPDDWRNANVSPLFKKGDRHLAVNYRPVSLTCVACKLMEHIITKHILDHCDTYNIITILQHGFRKGYSCASQLLITMHDLMKSYDSKHQVDIAILDFSKAFDTVPHERLLGKLHFYGIRGPVQYWIRQFLTDRYQRVVVNGVSSSSIKVASGVPQGTVLGPLLFLLYINDLPNNVTSQVRMFADDCLLYRNIKSQSDYLDLQNDLVKLEHWADKWGMRFNAQKCYILRVKTSRTPITGLYTLSGHVLEQVKENPYLGVQLSEDLKWSPHINKLATKANRSLAFLRRNLKGGPPKLKELAYFTLVRSLLDYCSAIWDPHLEKDIHNIEKIQRRAARFVKRDYNWEHSVTTMLNDLGWDNLADRRRESRLCFLHKIVYGTVAVPADEYLTSGVTRTRSNTKKFKHIYARTNIFKNSFFPRTVPDWNKLPEGTVNCVKTDTFKSHLRGKHKLD